MLKNCYLCTSRIKYVSELNTDWSGTKNGKRFVWLFREFIAKEAFTSKETCLLKTRYIRYITIATCTKDNCRRCNFFNARTIVKMDVHHFIGYKTCCTTIYIYVVIGIVIIINACRFVNFMPSTLGHCVPVHSSRTNINTDFFEFFCFLNCVSRCNHNFCRNTTAS